MRTSRKQPTQTMQDSFKKKQRTASAKRWGIRIFGFCVLAFALYAVFSIAQIFRHISAPIREFPHFDQPLDTRIDMSRQVYIGIWYEAESSPVKQNAVAVLSPDNAKISVHVLPSDISTLNPTELMQQTSLPLERYVVISRHMSKGQDIEEFVSNAADQWYSTFVGIGGYRALMHGISEVKNVMYTNLSPRELFDIAQFTRIVSQEDITVHEWSQTSGDAEKQRLAYFVDPTIHKEGKRIWVRNNTQIPGLANAAALLLKNIGFEIVRIDTFDCPAPGTTYCDSTRTHILTGETHADSYAIGRMTEVLGGEMEFLQIEDLSRADSIVVVGENLAYLVEEVETP